MAYCIQKLQDERFKNWLKGALAIIFCKEGLEDFVLDEMTQFQRDILQNIYTNYGVKPYTVCTFCTTANVLPCGTKNFCSVGKKCFVHDSKVPNKTPNQQCPNRICQRLSDSIRTMHRFTNPSWKNTDATLWCTDAFYIAKCYLPPDGYGGATSIREVDFNGVISAILTNKRFQNKLAINLFLKTNICTKARDIGRAVRHSSDLSIEDNDLNRYIDALVDLLSDAKYLSSDMKANDAVDKLRKLKVGSFVITTEDITKILEDTSKNLLSTSVGQMKDRHDEAIKSISQKEEIIGDLIEKHRKDINERKVKLLQEIQNEMGKLKHITNESLAELIEAKEIQIEEIRKEVDDMVALLKQSGEEERKYLVETGDLERKSLQQISKQVIDNIERLVSSKLAEVQMTAETAIRDIQKTEAECITHRNDTDYLRLKSDLQEDLVEWYRHRYWTLPISPMVQENDAKLIEFYVNPTMYCTNQAHSNDSSNTEIRSYQDIFYTETYRCKNIYITADAGSGKTSFVQKMALTWCQSRSKLETEEIYFQNDDLESMGHFQFLFVIILREANLTECGVDDFIESQVLRNLSRARQYTADIMERILHEEKCLVILDGLDEWMHPVTRSPKLSCWSTRPKIPHKKARLKTTFISTTRRWKMGNYSEAFSNIDKNIELKYLDKESSDKLTANVLSKLNYRYGKNKKPETFSDQLSYTQLYFDHIRYVPIMLIQLICLWFNGKAILKTSCQVFSEMIELRMELENEKHDLEQCEDSENDSKNSGTVDLDLIPKCLKRNGYIVKQFTLLKILGHLAYDASFGDNNELTTVTVFDRKYVLNYMTAFQLQYCFKLGLLTQSRSNNLSARMAAISFQHKLFQDYFAALFIASSNKTDSFDRVLRNWNSVGYFNNELWPMLKFLSGFSPGATSHIIAGVGRLLKEDTCTTRYRRSGYSFHFSNNTIRSHKLKLFQDKMITSLRISRETGNGDVHCDVKDLFFIKDDINHDNHKRCLKDIISWNKDNIKSVCILDYDDPEEISDIIATYGLVNLPSLQRLHLPGYFRADDIYQLLSGSVQTIENFQFDGRKSIKSNVDAPRNIPFYDKRLHVFQKMKHLQVLYLRNAMMLHDQIRQLRAVISLKTDMEYVGLYNIMCKQHGGYTCGDGTLDLSKHCKLKVLRLGYFPVQKLLFNALQLQEYRISWYPDSEVMASAFNSLEKAENLETMYCHDMKTCSNVTYMITALQKLTCLQNLVIRHCDFGDEELLLPLEMKRLEYLFMFKTSMTCSSLRKLVNRLETYPEYVEVRLWKCKILPQEDYNTFKTYIRNSEIWKVLLDGPNAWEKEEFRFDKNKNTIFYKENICFK
ncbi:uncharacterized protein LOC128555325 [Mercenaria mercenaria]|uniref:uncharacterized protein LOC128555325 n=1 Tax=Mercenaria mercenaria TaxID=6596 RepID=UPI00234F8586|nr:uncharacterized protein LOC128555325 [Mercenaria mercenaria]